MASIRSGSAGYGSPAPETLIVLGMSRSFVDRLSQCQLVARSGNQFCVANNARDMDAVLAAMHEDVVWANGMEGGHVHGRDQVRNYWTRQWAMIDPYVEPVAFAHGPEGEVVVEVHQVVHDLNGKSSSG